MQIQPMVCKTPNERGAESFVLYGEIIGNARSLEDALCAGASGACAVCRSSCQNGKLCVVEEQCAMKTATCVIITLKNIYIFINPHSSLYRVNCKSFERFSYFLIQTYRTSQQTCINQSNV